MMVSFLTSLYIVYHHLVVALFNSFKKENGEKMEMEKYILRADPCIMLHPLIMYAVSRI